jgi:alpha-beta hydrolase superfamily lysophospholipase
MIRDTQLKATDGAALYGWFREPVGAPPSAIIAHVHGMGEHSRRYDHVTAYWESIGWACAGFDLRGHGRSEGPRGHAPSYVQLMDDITTLLDAVDARWPGVPIVLYGHSLGGGLVLNHAVRKRPAVTRVVATAPYLRLVDQPSSALVWAVKLASHIVPAVSLPPASTSPRSRATRRSFSGTVTIRSSTVASRSVSSRTSTAHAKKSYAADMSCTCRRS